MRRKRILTVLWLIVVFVVVVLTGCGGGAKNPFAAKPLRPAPPQSTAIDCAKLPAFQHRMGLCLPHPPPTSAIPRFLQNASITGFDLSNNDPVWGVGNWAAMAARNRFAYLKSIEGTGFYDSTAAPMAGDAKAVHLAVGGYDFLHVCGNSASDEAAFFVRALRAQGLLGPGTLPPAADAEYGSGYCGGATWMNTWVSTVYALDGHVCPIAYTGAWWWNPNLGGYWPLCQGHSILSWISGYGVSYPYMPSGLSHLDFWQLSDSRFNGASYADFSVWMHDSASFAAFANVIPPDPYAFLSKVTFTFEKINAQEYADVKFWDQHGCRNPVKRPICVTDRHHLDLLAGRLWYVAHHPVLGGPATKHGDWSFAQRGKRFQAIWTRLQKVG